MAVIYLNKKKKDDKVSTPNLSASEKAISSNAQNRLEHSTGGIDAESYAKAVEKARNTEPVKYTAPAKKKTSYDVNTSGWSKSASTNKKKTQKSYDINTSKWSENSANAYMDQVKKALADKKTQETFKGWKPGTDFDSTFSDSYFKNSSEYQNIVNKLTYDPENATAQEWAISMDYQIRSQAGKNESKKKLGKPLNTGLINNELYAENDDYNQNRTAVPMQIFFKLAGEDDYKAIIDDFQSKIDAAPDSDYKRRMQETLDEITDHYTQNFSSGANWKMNQIAGEAAELNRQIREASAEQKTVDSKLISEANGALEWIGNGSDIITTVENNQTLKNAVGYDRLLSQYGDDERALSSALYDALEEISSQGDVKNQISTGVNDLNQQYHDAMSSLTALSERRDQLLAKEQRSEKMKENWVPEAAKQFNVPDYKLKFDKNAPYELQQTQAQQTPPTLAQIVNDPKGIYTLWEDAMFGNTGGSETSQTAYFAGYMTDEESQYFKAMHAVYGEKASEEFFNDILPELQERAAVAEQIGIYNSANDPDAKWYEQLLRNVGMSAFSVGANMLAPVESAYRLATGDNGYGATGLSRLTSDIRGSVTENVSANVLPDWKLPKFLGGGSVTGALYNLGMSIADNLAQGSVGKFLGGSDKAVKRITLSMMGSSAFNSELNAGLEAAKRGDITEKQAYENAFMKSGIEILTENVNLDKWLLDAPKSGAFKDVLNYVFQSSLGEAEEEGASYILGLASDYAVYGHNELDDMYNSMVNNGYTKGQAFALVAAYASGQTLLNAVGGFISGAALAGPSGIGTISETNAYNRSVGEALVQTENYSAIINMGLDSDNPEIVKLAKRLAGKIYTDEDGVTALPDDAETRAELTLVAQETGSDTDTRAADLAAQRLEEERAAEETAEAAEEGNNAREERQEQTFESLRAVQNETGNNAMEKRQEENFLNRPAQNASANTDTDAAQAEAPKEIKKVFKGSKRQLGALYGKVLKAFDVELQTMTKSEMDNAKAELTSRFEKYGIDKSPIVIDAMVAAAYGEELTQDQKDILEADAQRQGIVNDVMKDLVLSPSTKLQLMRSRVVQLQAATYMNIGDPVRDETRTNDAMKKKAEEKGVTVSESGSTVISDEEGNDIGAEIKGITTAEDGSKQAVIVVDGEERTVSIDSVRTGSENQQIVLSEAADMEDTGAASAMVSSYDGMTNARDYVLGFQQAMNYGRAGVSSDIAKSNVLVSRLTDDQLQAATAAGEAAAKSIRKTSASTSGGKVRIANDVDYASLTSAQKASINVIRKIAQIGAVNVEIFRSKANDKGSYTDFENGNYDPMTNTIRIDVNSGKNGVNDLAEYAMLRTMSHELTHYIKAQNIEGYKNLQDFVVQYLTKGETDVFDGLVNSKMQRDSSIDYETAVEEVVADGCEMMLKNSDAIQRMAYENTGLFRKVRSWVRNFVNSLKKAFSGVSATHFEAQILEKAEGLQKIWDDALLKAMKNVQTEQRTQARAEYIAAEEERFRLAEAKARDDFNAYMQTVEDKTDAKSEPTIEYDGKHIDARTNEDLTDKNVQPFFNDFLELYAGFAYDMAQTIRDDLATSSAAGSAYNFDTGTSDVDVFRWGRNTSNLIAKYKDSYNLTWDQIRAAFDAFTGMASTLEPLPNTKAVKVIELMVDEALTNGYTTMDGIFIQPVVDYIREKAKIVGTNYEGWQYTDDSKIPDGVSLYELANQSAETKFSMREPAERVGNLIALHNLSEENLMKNLALGGFPAPSIAIVNAQTGHTKFGDISVVFRSETIDPSADRNNRVYGSDAWTATFPETGYEVDGEKFDTLYSKLYELKKKIPDFVSSGILSFTNKLYDGVSKFSYVELLKEAKKNSGIMAAFIADKFGTVETFTKQVEKESGFIQRKAPFYDEFINALGVDRALEMKSIPVNDLMSEFDDLFGNAIFNYKNLPNESSQKWNRVAKFVQQADAYMRYGGTEYESVVDQDETLNNIKKKIKENEADFDEWLNENLHGIIGRNGVRNSKDWYTPSGNRRSYNQIYDEYNLSNIVKAMRALDEKNSGGTTNAFAAASKKFASIDEIRSDESRLKIVDEQTHNKAVSDLNERFTHVIDSIVKNTINGLDTITKYDEAEAIILDAVSNGISAGKILDALEKHRYNASTQDVRELYNIIREMQSMPTEYFEAKPMRAVGLDEVAAVIVPDSIRAETMQALDSAGVKTIQYSDGNEEERLKALNGLNDVKFSKRNEIVDDDDYRTYGMQWVYDADLLDKQEQRMFHEATANIQYRKYEAHNTTSDGMYFVDTHSSLIFCDGIYKNPQIYAIIKINTDNPDLDIQAIKEEMFGEDVSRNPEFNETWEAIEVVLGEEYAKLFLRPNERYGEETGRRKGKESGSNSKKDDGRWENSVKHSQRDFDYMAAVSTGDMETAQRLVDEAAQAAGYSRRMFHGSRNGGNFNTFKDWSYFTENEQYAKRYTNQSTGEGMYEVYVKMDKAFDTRTDAKARRVFAQMRSEYGLSEIGDRGLPDWTDGYDIADFIDENGLEYDTIVLDEGGDMVNGQPVYRGDSYVVRKSAQIKSADPVTYDDAGNVIPLSQRFNAQEDDIRYSLRDADAKSDRGILSTALMGAAQNEMEQKYLENYQNKIRSLNKDEAQLKEIRARMREMMFSKGERGKEWNREMTSLKNKSKILSDRINKGDKELLNLEAAKPLKNVLERERVKVETKNAEARREAVQHVRQQKEESIGKAKYRVRLANDMKTLRTWLTSPTNKEHVPEFLRTPLGNFLNSFNYASVRKLDGGDQTQNDQKITEAMDRLREALAKARNTSQGIETTGAEYFSGYLDLPADFIDTFDALRMKIQRTLENSKGISDIPINRMTAAQLKDLSQAMRLINAAVRNMNRLINNASFESARGAARNTINLMDKMGERKDQSKIGNAISSMIDWRNVTPYYVFQRFGEGGKSIFTELMDGWDRMAYNSKALVDFANGAYTTKEVQSWSKDVRTIKLSNGSTIRMTVAQMMSLYCLAKREQAVGHLMGGGIKIAEFENGKMKSVKQAQNYTLTMDDVSGITGQLTARQRAVADDLQNYMATNCAEWGNEISMKRFGYNMFGEENYFPITTDDNTRPGIRDDGTSGTAELLRLLNMSATKSLVQNANNALVVSDIFDVFTAHATDMAKYNALALPILDTLKWYNFVEREVDPETGKVYTNSTQRALEAAYGTEAKKYIKDLLKDLNGVHEAGRGPGAINKLISNYKIAQVAANLRVGMLQITSMPRAAYAIDPKYLAIGTAQNVAFKNSSKAEAECGIALWKSMGFYDTNISRDVRELVKHDSSAVDKIKEKSMFLAEKGDYWTMGVLYGAVQAELADKHPELKQGTEEYKKALNDRMREIVYKTQVVDSTLTRSSLMRDKGLTSIFTAFMSEPTLTMSMLQESIFEARMKAREAGEKFHLTAKTAKAFAVWGVTAGLAAIFEAAFTAWRDDDDYEKWIDKFLAALGLKGNVMDGSLYDNANLLHNIPYVSDVTEILEKMLRGETVGNATMGISPLEGLTATADGITNLLKVLRGESASYTTYGIIYKLMTGMSQVSGIAASGATRDGIAAFNAIAEQMGWRKIQTYPDSNSAAATSYYTAIKAGSDDDAKWVLDRAQLYGMTEEDIQKKIPDIVKKAYNGGEIDAETAQQHLTEYAGKNANDAYWTVQEWDAKAAGAESFSKYGTLRTAITNGSISEARAAMAELKDHGTDEKTILSDVTKLYNSGEATNLTSLELRAPNLYSTSSKKVDQDDFDSMITSIVTGRNIAGEVQKARGKYNHKQIMSAINGAFGKSSDVYANMLQFNPTQAKTLLSRILDAYEALGMSRAKEEAWIKENWFD